MKAQQSFAESRGSMTIAHEERSGGSYSFEIDRGWHGPGSQRQVHGADRRAVRCIYYRDVAFASQIAFSALATPEIEYRRRGLCRA
jgi:hypothetical protein